MNNAQKGRTVLYDGMETKMKRKVEWRFADVEGKSVYVL